MILEFEQKQKQEFSFQIKTVTFLNKTLPIFQLSFDLVEAPLNCSFDALLQK